MRDNPTNFVRTLLLELEDNSGNLWLADRSGFLRVQPVAYLNALPRGQIGASYKTESTEVEAMQGGFNIVSQDVEITFVSTNHDALVRIEQDLFRVLNDRERTEGRVLAVVGPSEDWDDDNKRYSRSIDLTVSR
ncbi:MAG: hypothetical protein OXB91_07405 [Bryobacterales bacterium]|nr:hypothetical protein [Bryobacterales bacterium]